MRQSARGTSADSPIVPHLLLLVHRSSSLDFLQPTTSDDHPLFSSERRPPLNSSNKTKKTKKAMDTAPLLDPALASPFAALLPPSPIAADPRGRSPIAAAASLRSSIIDYDNYNINVDFSQPQPNLTLSQCDSQTNYPSPAELSAALWDALACPPPLAHSLPQSLPHSLQPTLPPLPSPLPSTFSPLLSPPISFAASASNSSTLSENAPTSSSSAANNTLNAHAQSHPQLLFAGFGIPSTVAGVVPKQQQQQQHLHQQQQHLSSTASSVDSASSIAAALRALGMTHPFVTEPPTVAHPTAVTTDQNNTTTISQPPVSSTTDVANITGDPTHADAIRKAAQLQQLILQQQQQTHNTQQQLLLLMQQQQQLQQLQHQQLFQSNQSHDVVVGYAGVNPSSQPSFAHFNHCMQSPLSPVGDASSLLYKQPHMSSATTMSSRYPCGSDTVLSRFMMSDQDDDTDDNVFSESESDGGAAAAAVTAELITARSSFLSDEYDHDDQTDDGGSGGDDDDGGGGDVGSSTDAFGERDVVSQFHHGNGHAVDSMLVDDVDDDDDSGSALDTILDNDDDDDEEDDTQFPDAPTSQLISPHQQPLGPSCLSAGAPVSTLTSLPPPLKRPEWDRLTLEDSLRLTDPSLSARERRRLRDSITARNLRTRRRATLQPSTTTTTPLPPLPSTTTSSHSPVAATSPRRRAASTTQPHRPAQRKLFITSPARGRRPHRPPTASTISTVKPVQASSAISLPSSIHSHDVCEPLPSTTLMMESVTPTHTQQAEDSSQHGGIGIVPATTSAATPIATGTITTTTPPSVESPSSTLMDRRARLHAALASRRADLRAYLHRITSREHILNVTTTTTSSPSSSVSLKRPRRLSTRLRHGTVSERHGFDTGGSVSVASVSAKPH